MYLLNPRTGGDTRSFLNAVKEVSFPSSTGYLNKAKDAQVILLFISGRGEQLYPCLSKGH